MELVVTGLGYVGLVTAVCMAERGNTVVCVDVDDQKIEALKRCEATIFEKNLACLLRKNHEKMRFTTDFADAYRNATMVMICVGTPERSDGSADLSYVRRAAEQIAEHVESDCIVIVKSTTPIGTNDKIEQAVRARQKNNVRIDVVSNPEFLAQGTAVDNTLNASRIVLGVENERAKQAVLELYRDFERPVVLTSRRSAEMIKYASNNFLAMKISFMNEIANLCEKIDADIEDIAAGMGFDERIGKAFLNAGIGYGGSCFPKDTKALYWLSNFHDRELKTVKAAIEVNERQKLKLIKKAKKYVSSFEDICIAVLGLTFKPDTDDIRDAPSLANLPILLEEGARLRVYDPVGEKNFKKFFAESDALRYCKTIDETLSGAQLCFIFTQWEEIKSYDARNFPAKMRRAIILDGRNCFSLDSMKNIPVIYESIGRKTVDGLSARGNSKHLMDGKGRDALDNCI